MITKEAELLRGKRDLLSDAKRHTAIYLLLFAAMFIIASGTAYAGYNELPALFMLITAGVCIVSTAVIYCISENARRAWVALTIFLAVFFVATPLAITTGNFLFLSERTSWGTVGHLALLLMPAMFVSAIVGFIRFLRAEKTMVYQYATNEED